MTKQTLIIKDTILDCTVVIDESGKYEVYKGDLLVKNLLHTCTINLNTFTIDKLFNDIGYLYLMEGRK